MKIFENGFSSAQLWFILAMLLFAAQKASTTTETTPSSGTNESTSEGTTKATTNSGSRESVSGNTTETTSNSGTTETTGGETTSTSNTETSGGTGGDTTSTSNTETSGGTGGDTSTSNTDTSGGTSGASSNSGTSENTQGQTNGADSTPSTTIDPSYREESLNNATIRITNVKYSDEFILDCSTTKCRELTLRIESAFYESLKSELTLLRIQVLSYSPGSVLAEVLIESESSKPNTNFEVTIEDAITTAASQQVNGLTIDPKSVTVQNFPVNETDKGFTNGATFKPINPEDFLKGDINDVFEEIREDEDYYLENGENYLMTVTVPCFIALSIVILIFCMCTASKNSPLFAICSTQQSSKV